MDFWICRFIVYKLCILILDGSLVHTIGEHFLFETRTILFPYFQSSCIFRKLNSIASRPHLDSYPKDCELTNVYVELLMRQRRTRDACTVLPLVRKTCNAPIHALSSSHAISQAARQSVRDKLESA